MFRAWAMVELWFIPERLFCPVCGAKVFDVDGGEGALKPCPHLLSARASGAINFTYESGSKSRRWSTVAFEMRDALFPGVVEKGALQCLRLVFEVPGPE